MRGLLCGHLLVLALLPIAFSDLLLGPRLLALRPFDPQGMGLREPGRCPSMICVWERRGEPLLRGDIHEGIVRHQALHLRGGAASEEGEDSSTKEAETSPSGEEVASGEEAEDDEEDEQDEGEEDEGSDDDTPVEELVSMGRLAIAEQDYSRAADYLSAALSRQVAAHGDLATECAEYYYLYGTALALEADKADGDELFGPRVPKIFPVGLENETMTNTTNVSESLAAVREFHQKGVAAARAERKKANGTNVSGTNETGGDGVEEEGEEEGGEEEEEEDPRAQAWEVLDTARIILQRVKEMTPAQEMMLGDIFMRLGDLHCYNEVYDRCYQDYDACLSIRKKLCAKDDRRLLEAYYICGMTLIYMGNRTEGMSHLRAAVDVCKAKVNVSVDEREKKEFGEIAVDLERRIEDEEMPHEPIPPEFKDEEPQPLIENPNEEEFEEVNAQEVKPKSDGPAAAAHEGDGKNQRPSSVGGGTGVPDPLTPKKRSLSEVATGGEGEVRESHDAPHGGSAAGQGSNDTVGHMSPPKMARTAAA